MNVVANSDGYQLTTMQHLSDVEDHIAEIEIRSNASISDDIFDDSIDTNLIVKRLLGLKSDSITPVELLSFLLTFMYSPLDAETFARQLYTRFGSLNAVFAVSSLQLSGMIPRSNSCFALLKTVHRLLSSLLRESIENNTVLSKWSDLENYLRHTLAYERVETVRLLLLNSRNVLLKDELHASGTVNHITVYPREIVKSILDAHATALIIVHNHPCGDPTPSKEDVSMTKLLAQVLAGIKVMLHDHVIVGKNCCLSMKQLGLF